MADPPAPPQMPAFSDSVVVVAKAPDPSQVGICPPPPKPPPQPPKPPLTRQERNKLMDDARARDKAWQDAKRKSTPEDDKEKNRFKGCGCTTYGVGGTPAGGPQDSRFSAKSGVEQRDPVSDRRSGWADSMQFQTTKACKDPHIVQFIHRINVRDGQLQPDCVQAPNRTNYATTTDRNDPLWHLDRVDGKSPYYEGESQKEGKPPQCSCKGGLTTWDEPTVMPEEGEKMEAHFKTFFICDGKVVGEVDWSRVQEWKKGAAAAESAVYSATNVTDSGGMFNWVQNYVDNFNSSRFNWVVQPGAAAPVVPPVPPAAPIPPAGGA